MSVGPATASFWSKLWTAAWPYVQAVFGDITAMAGVWLKQFAVLQWVARSVVFSLAIGVGIALAGSLNGAGFWSRFWSWLLASVAVSALLGVLQVVHSIFPSLPLMAAKPPSQFID